MKTEILQMLRGVKDGSYISGQELCKQLGVSRTAVWKTISQLRELGYEIEAAPNRGYRLNAVPDLLSESEIESWLHTKWLGHPICYLDEVDSTNTQAKRIAEETGSEGHGTVVVAGKQTSGRGRRGRNWSSPHGTGIFFTILLKPDIEISNAPMLTLVKALATASAIRELTGLEAKIKWPNDIVVNGKKVVGILTELSAQIDYVNHIVIGTGINVHQAEFPEEIAKTATSLDLELQREGRQAGIQRARLLAMVLEKFEHYYEVFLKTQELSSLEGEYNSLLVNCGRKVRVLDPQGEYEGQAIGIDSRGELLVERENGIVKVSSGEVSVRGIYGYV